MLVHRPRLNLSSPRHQRTGFFCLGALREVFVLASAVSIVTVCLWQSSAFMKVHLAADKQPNARKLLPVLALNVDRERGAVLAHVWGGQHDEISLDTGDVTQQTIFPEVIAYDASQRNSVVAHLSEWAEGGAIHHRVDIFRRGEILISEEFGTQSQTSATVNVSADGTYAIVMTLEGNAIGWELRDEEPKRHEFTLEPLNVENNLSPDGNRLFVSADQATPYFCDSRTGQSKVELQGLTGFCCCSEWTSDGRYLAVGNQHGDVIVFDTTTGKQVWHQRLDFMFARAVSFSLDGTQLACGGFDHKTRIWNLSEPEQPPKELKGQYGIVRGLVFGPNDQTLVSASFEGTIHEWSVATGQLLRQLR
ncbi:WD40 repeat domain-containing protein [Schlesneria sp. T3-172]|uniref:WD40 repeat domain-containing protein n=1 Tax=Schlesneria sphaerica TaxID=3373610 RepID=UPI0037C8C042